MDKLEIPLSPELEKKIDNVVELLGFDSREELVDSAIRRFVDKYNILDIKVR